MFFFFLLNVNVKKSFSSNTEDDLCVVFLLKCSSSVTLGEALAPYKLNN